MRNGLIVKCKPNTFKCVLLMLHLSTCVGEAEYFNGSLEDEHVKAWRDIWSNGRVDIEGEQEVAKVTYASYYYILSSIPVTNDTDLSFVGLSPGDLAHGAYLQVRCLYLCCIIQMFSISSTTSEVLYWENTENIDFLTLGLKIYSIVLLCISLSWSLGFWQTSLTLLWYSLNSPKKHQLSCSGVIYISLHQLHVL